MRHSWAFWLAVLGAAAQTPGGMTERLVSQTRLPGVAAIQALATDPAGNVYVAGTAAATGLPVLNAFRQDNNGKQIATSADGGATWNALANLASFRMRSLAVDPTAPGTLYAAANDAVYRSTDGGATWRTILNAGAASIAIDPKQQPRTIAACRGGYARAG